MKRISKLVRKNIINLKPYSSAREEYMGKEGIFLDANENPYGMLNRYPDPLQNNLKKRLSSLKKIPIENIFIGNGSDEIIDLAFRIFCSPGKDNALTISPSYGMYDVAAEINDIKLEKIQLDKNFKLDPEELRKSFIKTRAKLFILCSPNNPSANAFPKTEIIEVLKEFKGIILIDEAYIDFSRTESWTKELETLPNLIVSQTFSKALGLAAARIGVAYSDREIIRIFTAVKPPYNVSTLNQEAALSSLDKLGDSREKIESILESRKKLEKELKGIARVKKIYPSDANFLLVEFDKGPLVFNELIRRKIITRNRHSLVKNSIRISVGTEKENQALINALKQISI